MRETRRGFHFSGMEVEQALSRLCNHSIAFGLYADHRAGMSIEDLAALSSRSEEWVRERIESARLCLELQVRIIDVESSPVVAA